MKNYAQFNEIGKVAEIGDAALERVAIEATGYDIK